MVFVKTLRIMFWIGVMVSEVRLVCVCVSVYVSEYF